MESVHKADKTEFKECLKLTWKHPYILQLAFSAGIGGLLFGYDTGKEKEKEMLKWKAS